MKEKLNQGINMQVSRAIFWLLMMMLPLLTFTILDPIPQPPEYYNFADDRTLLCINSFWNVVTNLPFLLVGVWGLLLERKKQLVHDNPPGFPAYSWFFTGVLLTAFGSAWFHLEPRLETLLWDRLPMTIGFIALTVGLVSEFLKRGLEKWLLYPMLLIGLFSVLYWFITEKAGAGDLRLYLLVQFLPMIILLYLVLCFSSRFSRSYDLYWILILYTLAKVAEYYDSFLYQLLGFSGHSLKHLLAAASCVVILRMLVIRHRLQRGDS